MDLVTRLRNYIDHIAMPVTQFADTCGIPRPSMSQLLSGRNKKVSNELISKIHDAFPELNVLWLMFGQGDMLVKENFQVSEPQKSPIGEEFVPQSTNSQNIGKTIVDFGVSSDSVPEKFQQSTVDSPADYNSDSEAAAGSGCDRPSSPSMNTPLPSTSSKPEGPIQSIALHSDRSKRIVNIIVYYSDNSFEAFVPEQYNPVS